MHSMPNFAVLREESRRESSRPNNNKQPYSCQASLRTLLFHLVQGISLHFKSPDLYLFCTTKVFPKFLLPFKSQASFQSEEFGSNVYSPSSLSLVACFLSSLSAHALTKKIPVNIYTSGANDASRATNKLHPLQKQCDCPINHNHYNFLKFDWCINCYIFH